MARLQHAVVLDSLGKAQEAKVWFIACHCIPAYAVDACSPHVQLLNNDQARGMHPCRQAIYQSLRGHPTAEVARKVKHLLGGFEVRMNWPRRLHALSADCSINQSTACRFTCA